MHKGVLIYIGPGVLYNIMNIGMESPILYSYGDGEP